MLSLGRASRSKRRNIFASTPLFVPVARNEFIPALLESRGDIASANLTITPERLKQVDFADPWVVRIVHHAYLVGFSAPGPWCLKISSR